MLRVLFSVLVVVIVVLAFVIEPYRTLLFTAAAVLLLIVAILWIGALRRRHRATMPTYPSRPPTPPLPEEDLKSLGIMEIRPKASSKPREAQADDPVPVPASAAAESFSEPPPPRNDLVESVALVDPTEPRAQLQEFVIPSSGEAIQEAVATETVASAGEDVLVPYLQSLRSVLHAHAVCLLASEDPLQYRVITLLNQAGVSQGTFTTRTPLLPAARANHPVTVLPVGEDGLNPDNLGYHAEDEPPRRIAMAPVPCASASAYLLLADTLQDDFPAHVDVHALLPGFAGLLGALLDTLWTASSDTATLEPQPEPKNVVEDDAEETIRPRREIIAEEMERARAADQVLALALVYLNQAEDLAVEGPAVVADAEQLLEKSLRQATTQGRIVRFGELTYGVFYDGDLPEVEHWGAQVQQTLAMATGLLTGGVSIGIALLQDRHDSPDAFRHDATEALRAAYETGTCTILE